VSDAAGIARRARSALAKALSRTVPVDAKGYVASAEANLLPGVVLQDFAADLEAGSGGELAGKFRAAHSSSALAVNAFAPFRRRIADLRFPGIRATFTGLAFEVKCPTGLPRANPPNLDVMIRTTDAAIGIESKLTEYLASKPAKFSERYRTLPPTMRATPWYAEMERLRDAPDHYRCLDAAQLIKHAFGLMNHADGPGIGLVYLYWEPADAGDYPIFLRHRQEADDFAACVSGGSVRFRHMSYAALWTAWAASGTGWAKEHAAMLRGRYDVRIGDAQ
jgi:hypothetical protein